MIIVADTSALYVRRLRRRPARAQGRGKHEGLRLDLADAVGVVLADRYRTDRIFTPGQRGFRAVTPLTPGFSAFRILPVDA
ncbi:hypothetical protein [Streptomyces nitrosporeus]|uniref:hypothetical protein n=1 Tax=Streptomyces nitrosporeus TaxID=28894 RepID=UPI00199ECB28|nr:hypothetical protein [Streptomyces nitrosporeus]GGZ17799.1 hypothetical protein GCM10010327_56110 [Streptomyces nitrosporeus]